MGVRRTVLACGNCSVFVAQSLVARVGPGPASLTGVVMMEAAPCWPLCARGQPERCRQSSADHSLFVSGNFSDSLLPRQERVQIP